MIQKYVLGFLFNPKQDSVVLIRKKKPDWQNGFWNGVGGKIEQDETDKQAMSREFLEETGINHTNWEYIGYMESDYPQEEQWIVTCYKGTSPFVHEVQTITDEEVLCIPLGQLDYFPLLPNIKWLIEFCLDNSGQQFATTYYKK